MTLATESALKSPRRMYEDPAHYRASQPAERITLGLLESLPGTFAVVKHQSQYTLLVCTSNPIGKRVISVAVDRSVALESLLESVRKTNKRAIPYFQAMEEKIKEEHISKRSCKRILDEIRHQAGFHPFLLPPATIREILLSHPSGSFLVTSNASAGYRLSWRLDNRLENDIAMRSSLIIFAAHKAHLENFPEECFDSFKDLRTHYGLTKPIELDPEPSRPNGASPATPQQRISARLEASEEYFSPSELRGREPPTFLSQFPRGTYLLTKDKQGHYVLYATDQKGFFHHWSLRFGAGGRFYVQGGDPTVLLDGLGQLIALTKIPNLRSCRKVGRESPTVAKTLAAIEKEADEETEQQFLESQMQALRLQQDPES